MYWAIVVQYNASMCWAIVVQFNASMCRASVVQCNASMCRAIVVQYNASMCRALDVQYNASMHWARVPSLWWFLREVGINYSLILFCEMLFSFNKDVHFHGGV